MNKNNLKLNYCLRQKYQEHLIVIQTIKHVIILFKTESIFFP